jgi:CubicO group peptidase (beta-lactamase class C family)
MIAGSMRPHRSGLVAFGLLAVLACTRTSPSVSPGTAVVRGQAAAAPTPVPARDPVAAIDLSAQLEQLRAEAGVPALAAVVIDGERTLAQGVAGVRRRGAEPRASLDDAFHLGSDTKAVTAFVAARLVDAGVITWDTTIADALPELRKGMHAELRTATLEQLLQHRAGIAASFDDAPVRERLRDRDVVEQRRIVATAVLAKAPARAPGLAFEYSNIGYLVAGAMLEARTGKSWEALVREHVLEPMALRSCGFGATATMDAPDGVWGHAGKAPEYLALAIDNPAYLGPAGTLHCSLPDWAVFVRSQLLRDPKLLLADTWTRLQRPLAIGERGGYAMGWAVTAVPWANGIVLTHDGSNTMNYVSAMLLVDRGVAVLVACNAGDEVAQRTVVTTTVALAKRFSAPQ